MKKFILAIGLALALQQSAMAGFAEGATAYNNKNYALALKEIAPLAKAGNARRRCKARPTRNTWSAPCTTRATR